MRVEASFWGSFLANKPDDIRVTGPGQARELFKSLVRERGLGANICYRGVVSGAEKLRALEWAHFFVLPTHYDNEGQPLSIIEAMAQGAS